MRIVAVFLVFIGITATFFHKIFPTNDIKQNLVTEKRNQLKSNWNTKEAELDDLLKSGNILIIDYLEIKKKNEGNRIADFKEIAKERKKVAVDFSFNGRANANFWFWVFGTHLTLLIISCYLAVKDIRLKKVGLLKWYEPSASISFIAISLFWIYHTIFLKSRDFQFSTYTTILILIIIPFSIFLYHSLRRIVIMEERLLSNVGDLVSHVLHYTKEDKEKEKWDVLDKVSKNGE